MAANPLTYTELEAFERKALVRLSAWETDLIMRLDDAVLALWARESGPGKGGVPVDDPQAVRGVLRGVAAKKKKAAKGGTT